jgi:hypothetical protein
MYTKSILKKILVSLALFIMSSNIFAKELKLSPFTINSYVKMKYNYEDNVYFTKDNVKSAAALITEPNLKIALDNKDYKFYVIYNPEIVDSDISRFDTVRQNFDGVLDFNLPIGLNIKVNDSYKKTDNPPYSEIVEKLNRTEENLNTEMTLDLSSKLFIGAGYSDFSNEYEDAPYKTLLSYKDTKMSGKIGCKIFSKTSLFVKYNEGAIDYIESSNMNDSDYFDYNLGLEGKLTPKTNGVIEIGSQEREYKDKDKKFTTFLYRLSTNTMFSERKSLKLLFEKRAEESIYQNNLYYFSDKFSAEMPVKFSTKWKIKPGASYELAYYPEKILENSAFKKREDNLLSLDLGIFYYLSKCSKIGVKYSYTTRDSNIDSVEYTSNNITCFFKIGF